jgi:hypothetical protein
MLLEFVQHILDWNARYIGGGGWLAILCLVLTLYAAFAIVKSATLRTIRPDSFFGEDSNNEQKNNNGID